MLFTKASEYALLSMILLSQSGAPRDVDTMSAQLGISRSFLAKILQNLAKDGILNSYKGANGGFSLAVSPAELSVGRILQSAEKKRASVFECGSDCTATKAQTCKIRTIFGSLQTSVDEFLDKITLADILKQ